MPFKQVLKALYSYEPEGDDELAFAEDDLLCIIDQQEEDGEWLLARLLKSEDGQTGLIPANYVEPLESLGQVQALYDYEASEDNELTFKEEETLTLLSKVDADWWLMRNANGEVGLIPSNYVDDVAMESQLPANDNIFEQTPPKISYDTNASHDLNGQVFKDALPKAQITKKFSAELSKSNKQKIKGKLYIYDSNQLAFVNKEKVIQFHHPLAFFHDLDLASGLLSGKTKSYYLAMSKSDSKELSAIIKNHAGTLNMQDPSHETVTEESLPVKEVDDYQEPYHRDHEQDPQENQNQDYKEQQAENEEQNSYEEEALAVPKPAQEPLYSMALLYDYHDEDAPEEYAEWKEGDIADILDDSSDDWWQVRHPSSHHVTMIPKTYFIREQEDEEPNSQLEYESEEPSQPKEPDNEPEEHAMVEPVLPPRPAVVASSIPPPPPLPSRPIKVEPAATMVAFEEDKKEAPSKIPVVAHVAAPSLPTRPDPPKLKHEPIQSQCQSASALVPRLNTEQVDSRLEEKDPLDELKKKMEAKMNSIKNTSTNNLTVSPKDHASPLNSHLSHSPVATSSKAPAIKSNPWSGVILKKGSSSSSKSGENASFNLASLQKTLPSRPEKAQSSDSKHQMQSLSAFTNSSLEPSPSETRLWKDRSGTFQTEAAFISYDSGKILLHKLNGNRITVPLDSLSDRDVEFVRRKCGITIPTRKESSNSSQAAANSSLSQSTNKAVSKPSGFDWRALFEEAGLRGDRSNELHLIFAQKHLDENWLETVNREALKNAGNLSDTECLMVMQIITKRRLKRLEQIGQEKILQSIKNTHSIGQSLTSNKLSPPLMPTPVMRPTPAPAQSPQAMAAPQQKSSVMTAQPVQVQPGPQRSVRDIPSLQPQNSVTSVKMPIQPVMKEFTSSTLVPMGNSPYMAQQFTTTQYMATRSSSSATDPVALHQNQSVHSNYGAQNPYTQANYAPPPAPSNTYPAFPNHQTQVNSNNFANPMQLGVAPLQQPVQPMQPMQMNSQMRPKFADPMGIATNPYQATQPTGPATYQTLPLPPQQQLPQNPMMMAAPPTAIYYAPSTQPLMDPSDKYAIFKQVDPRSPSFIGAPQQQPQMPQNQTYQPPQPPPGQATYYNNPNPNYQNSQWRPVSFWWPFAVTPLAASVNMAKHPAPIDPQCDYSFSSYNGRSTGQSKKILQDAKRTSTM